MEVQISLYGIFTPKPRELCWVILFEIFTFYDGL